MGSASYPNGWQFRDSLFGVRLGWFCDQDNGDLDYRSSRGGNANLSQLKYGKMGFYLVTMAIFRK
jgi:hypothetical protein